MVKKITKKKRSRIQDYIPKELKTDYRIWLEDQEVLASRFRLSVSDLHNLYDLLYLMPEDMEEILKLNNMDIWFKEFFLRLDKIIFYDAYDLKTITIPTQALILNKDSVKEIKNKSKKGAKKKQNGRKKSKN